jgi:hypothetical protein
VPLWHRPLKYIIDLIPQFSPRSIAICKNERNGFTGSVGRFFCPYGGNSDSPRTQTHGEQVHINSALGTARGAAGCPHTKGDRFNAADIDRRKIRQGNNPGLEYMPPSRQTDERMTGDEGLDRAGSGK